MTSFGNSAADSRPTHPRGSINSVRPHNRQNTQCHVKHNAQAPLCSAFCNGSTGSADGAGCYPCCFCSSSFCCCFPRCNSRYAAICKPNPPSLISTCCNGFNMGMLRCGLLLLIFLLRLDRLAYSACLCCLFTCDQTSRCATPTQRLKQGLRLGQTPQPAASPAVTAALALSAASAASPDLAGSCTHCRWHSVVCWPSSPGTSHTPQACILTGDPSVRILGGPLPAAETSLPASDQTLLLIFPETH